jgi:outer membrane receptor protein involved in Fe transport
MFGGKTSVKLGYASFKDKEASSRTRPNICATPRPIRTATASPATSPRPTWKTPSSPAKLEHKRDLTGTCKVQFGVQYEKKQRDLLVTEVPRNRYNLPAANPPAFGPYAVIDGGDARSRKTRLDPYVMLDGKSGALKWEAGLRYETTDVTLQDRTVPSTTDIDYNFLLPSASLRYNLTETTSSTSRARAPCAAPASTTCRRPC